MSITISDLTEAALQGDWDPLLREAKNAPGKHWAEESSCAGHDTDLFFLVGDSPRKDPESAIEQLGLALVRPLNLCASCPLATAARCLVESIRGNEEFGIRGGLLASERSALRSGWQNRMSEKAVQSALRGCTATLSKDEREMVIARFATDRSLEPATVARGLGVTREYLLKLARRHRKKTRTASPPLRLIQGTDAA